MFTPPNTLVSSHPCDAPWESLATAGGTVAREIILGRRSRLPKLGPIICLFNCGSVVRTFVLEVEVVGNGHLKTDSALGGGKITLCQVYHIY